MSAFLLPEAFVCLPAYLSLTLPCACVCLCRCAFWAAGFSFSRAALLKEVPYDPHLPFLFFGEEISMVLRMWSRGWDLYAPDRHVLYHRWERSYRTTFWEVSGGAALKKASQSRVRRMLTAPAADAAAYSAEEANLTATDVEEAGREEERKNMGEVVAVMPAETKEAMAEAAVAEAEEEVAAALQGVPGLSDPVWGVGRVRALSAYEAYAGVDFRAKVLSGGILKGGLNLTLTLKLTTSTLTSCLRTPYFLPQRPCLTVEYLSHTPTGRRRAGRAGRHAERGMLLGPLRVLACDAPAGRARQRGLNRIMMMIRCRTVV